MKRNGVYKKTKRKMNSRLKTINKQLRQDVFGDRFEVRAFRLDVVDYYDGYPCSLEYGIECIDHKTGHTERIYWVDEFQFFTAHTYKIFELVNRVIIESDFWDEYRKTHPREG